MMIRYFAIALGGLALTLGACVYPPPPDPMAGLQNCHQFTQDITVQGRTVAGYGVQCLQPDGSWSVAMPPQATAPSAAEIMPHLYSQPAYADPNAYASYYPYAGVDPSFPAYSGYGPAYYGADIVIGGGWGWGGGWGGWGGGGGNWWHGGGWHGGGWHGGGWGGHGGGHR